MHCNVGEKLRAYCPNIYVLWIQWTYLLFIDEDLGDKKRNVNQHTVGYKSNI
jgi:hypothetical protein